MMPEPAERSALVVWLQLAALLALVAVFGGAVYLVTASLRVAR